MRFNTNFIYILNLLTDNNLLQLPMTAYYNYIYISMQDSGQMFLSFSGALYFRILSVNPLTAKYNFS